MSPFNTGSKKHEENYREICEWFIHWYSIRLTAYSQDATIIWRQILVVFDTRARLLFVCWIRRRPIDSSVLKFLVAIFLKLFARFVVFKMDIGVIRYWQVKRRSATIRRMNSSKMYKRHRFPPEIIQYTVWLYYRFNLSHRDIEDLMSERGITVSYEAIRLWCNKFGPKYAQRLRRKHQGVLTS